MTNDNELFIYTVYSSPADFPDKFVMRRFNIGRGGEALPSNEVFVSDTLEGVRQSVPEGAMCLGREDGDDPVIVESWV